MVGLTGVDTVILGFGGMHVLGTETPCSYGDQYKLMNYRFEYGSPYGLRRNMAVLLGVTLYG